MTNNLPHPISAAEMRGVEQAAIASGKVSGLDLMERAAAGVCAAIEEGWPDLPQAGARAVVLCGPGNNGGDGFALARLLARSGWKVEVLFHGSSESLPPDARTNHDRWQALGPILPLTRTSLTSLDPADLYIDAIFGIGLSRPVTGEVAEVLRHLAAGRAFYQPRLIAIDIPSGLEADEGLLPGKPTEASVPPCPYCALTVTFHAPKAGHLRGRGPEHSGRIKVVDIGL